jgi:hypothetical protein
MRQRLAGAAVMLLIAGCAQQQPAPIAAPAQPYKCLLDGEQRMLIAHLFFGRNIRDRAPLTKAEWDDFAARTITPNFPAGFTVMDGEGQWQNPATGKISREPTKILLVATPRSPDLAARFAAVIDAYKSRFHQQSVGVITSDSCAGF